MLSKTEFFYLNTVKNYYFKNMLTNFEIDGS